MVDLIRLVNRHRPIPKSRRRVRIEVGGYVVFYGGVMLTVERETRDGESRILFRWRSAEGGEYATTADQPVSLGSRSGCGLVTRAITLRNEQPIAVLIELQGEQRRLLHAIEEAA